MTIKITEGMERFDKKIIRCVTYHHLIQISHTNINSALIENWVKISNSNTLPHQNEEQ